MLFIRTKCQGTRRKGIINSSVGSFTAKNKSHIQAGFLGLHQAGVKSTAFQDQKKEL
jgi:hypothetical protein